MRKPLHEALMAEALRLAARAKGRTHPNPAVGAVLAKGPRVLARGYHRRWGLPHAEALAIGRAGELARGADLYVTLEPCAHHGRTPPCSEAIIRSGVARVFVATVDPNPLVNGKGIRALRRAGVEVKVGILGKEARKMNESYFKFMSTGLPFVTLKVAQTLDGKIADSRGRSKWITSADARREVKAMRGACQADLVGLGTVMADDPELLPGPGQGGGLYLRCVLDTHLSIPAGCRLVRTAAEHPTVVYFNHDVRKRLHLLEKYGVKGVRIGPRNALSVHPGKVLRHLGGLGVQHVMVEGGARVFSSFLRAGLADRLVVFMAPAVMGGERTLGAFPDAGAKRLPGVPLEFEEARRISRDLVMTLHPAAGGRGAKGV